MIDFLYILGGLFILISLVFLSVDAWYWWMERYPRYKIGRWQNNNDWEEAVFKTAKSWLPNVPAVPVSHNTHLVLLDILQGKYTRKSVQVWQTGGLLLGVSEFSHEESLKVRKKTFNHFISSSGQWIDAPTNVDYGILAYALMRDNNSPQVIRPAMDELLELILNHKGEDGLIAYSGRSSIRYVDTIGLSCPFLARYSKVYNKPEIATLAVDQIEKFVEIGMFKDSWLPVHSYHVKTGLPVGVYGWGRGTGWFLLGLIDTYAELDDKPLKERLEKILVPVADNLLKYQWNDGGFGVFLQLNDRYDSSATAILAYFYAACYRIFRKTEYKIAADKSLNKLMKFTRRDGSLDYCQGDTVDVGIFSQRLDIMPFAQGMLLRAMSILNKSDEQ